MHDRSRSAGRPLSGLHSCIGIARQFVKRVRIALWPVGHGAEIDDYRRLEHICRHLAEESAMPEQRSAMLIMAERYGTAADVLEADDSTAMRERC